MQAMIEGLGILLTRMTAPPPAPPPLMEPAPQQGAALMLSLRPLERSLPHALTRRE